MAEHSYKGSLQGTVGETHAWDGPIDLDQFPQVKGSNRGPNGMQIKKYPCKSYELQEPITQRAKK